MASIPHLVHVRDSGHGRVDYLTAIKLEWMILLASRSFHDLVGPSCGVHWILSSMMVAMEDNFENFNILFDPLAPARWSEPMA